MAEKNKRKKRPDLNELAREIVQKATNKLKRVKPKTQNSKN